MDLVRRRMNSPVGTLELVASDRGLCAVLWEQDRPDRVPLGGSGRSAAEDGRDHLVLCQTARQIEEYFAGQRTVFDIPLDLHGTPFQQQVWAALRAIPFGETRSYGELARQVGNPQAMRAVGAANGRNPCSIGVPCHRVVGTDGKLTGFAGGLAVKAQLLQLEQAQGRLPLLV